MTGTNRSFKILMLTENYAVTGRKGLSPGFCDAILLKADIQ